MTANKRSPRTGGKPLTSSFWTSRAFLVCLGFLAIAILFLWTEHRAHILGAAFWLLILACPLLHIFMHGGHGGHGEHGSRTPPEHAGRDPTSPDGGKS